MHHHNTENRPGCLSSCDSSGFVVLTGPAYLLLSSDLIEDDAFQKISEELHGIVESSASNTAIKRNRIYSIIHISIKSIHIHLDRPHSSDTIQDAIKSAILDSLVCYYHRNGNAAIFNVQKRFHVLLMLLRYTSVHLMDIHADFMTKFNVTY